MTGNGEKRGIAGILLGLAAGVLLYIAFAGIKTASAETTMAGIAGAVLSMEALGNRNGLTQTLTSSVRNGVPRIQYNKSAGLLTGMVIGFLLGAVLMVFV